MTPGTCPPRRCTHCECIDTMLNAFNVFFWTGEGTPEDTDAGVSLLLRYSRNRLLPIFWVVLFHIRFKPRVLRFDDFANGFIYNVYKIPIKISLSIVYVMYHGLASINSVVIHRITIANAKHTCTVSLHHILRYMPVSALSIHST